MHAETDIPETPPQLLEMKPEIHDSNQFNPTKPQTEIEKAYQYLEWQYQIIHQQNKMYKNMLKQVLNDYNQSM